MLHTQQDLGEGGDEVSHDETRMLLHCEFYEILLKWIHG